MDSQSIRLVQFALDVWKIYLDSHPSGPVSGGQLAIVSPNGVLDSEFEGGLLDFQQAYGLPQTGVPDPSTISTLNSLLSGAGLGSLTLGPNDKVALTLTDAGKALLQHLQPGESFTEVAGGSSSQSNVVSLALAAGLIFFIGRRTRRPPSGG